MNNPRKSREATPGGLNAGDLPVESRVEGTGKSLVYYSKGPSKWR